MHLPNTPDNRALAAAVNKRIHAEGAMLAAQASVWRLGGVGVLLLLAGVGVGAACVGYSYVNDSRTSADKMAGAFAQALDHANLGRVRLDTSDNTIKLDPDALIHLDPNATVKVIGTVIADVPKPTERQLGAEMQPQSREKAVTNYTVFKTVAFRSASIATGWNFDSSEQDVPSSQFCQYYVNIGPDVRKVITIATNGQIVTSALALSDIDAKGAMANCVWFQKP